MNNFVDKVGLPCYPTVRFGEVSCHSIFAILRHVIAAAVVITGVEITAAVANKGVAEDVSKSIHVAIATTVEEIMP